MMSWEKVLATFLIFIMLICLGAIIYLWPHQYPKNWDDLELGMTRSEVYKVIPKIDQSWRGVKGYERVSHGKGGRFWNLHIYYDHDLRVRRITKLYVNTKVGLFNQRQTIE